MLFVAAFSANALHSNQKLSPKYYRNAFCQIKMPILLGYFY